MVTKTHAVQLKDSDAALLSNLRRYAHELGGIGAPAYLDLLHRIDLALSAPLAEPAPEWHSPPLARLYAAELVDAEKLAYRVPSGEILMVFDGSPDDHAPCGMAQIPIAWPAFPEAVPPGRCTVDLFVGGIRLYARPAFPVTALVRPGYADRAEDVAPGTFTGKPTSEADRDRIIEASAGGQSVSEGYPFKPLAGQFCRCGLLYAFVAGTVVCNCGYTLTGPILSREDLRKAWFRRDGDDEPERGPKPPLGAVPDFVWRYRRAKELNAAIDRYLAWADDPAVDGRNLPAWAAELAEHLRWLADREAK